MDSLGAICDLRNNLSRADYLADSHDLRFFENPHPPPLSERFQKKKRAEQSARFLHTGINII
jgi:hypothetical protein